MKGKASEKLIIGIVIVLVVGVLAFSLLNPKQTPQITTIGNSQMKVQPDEAVVFINIETKDPTSAEAAKNKNDVISNDVITSLLTIGIDRSDIETSNFNVQPQYDWTNSKQTLIGYTATNSLKITTKDFGLVGKVVDVSVDSGAYVNYINFELSSSKQNEYKTAALKEATTDARAKAQAIADGLGKRVGNLLSVSTSDYNWYPYPLYQAGSVPNAGVKEASANIIPQKLDVSAQVTTVYEIV